LADRIALTRLGADDAKQLSRRDEFGALGLYRYGAFRLAAFCLACAAVAGQGRQSQPPVAAAREAIIVAAARALNAAL